MNKRRWLPRKRFGTFFVAAALAAIMAGVVSAALVEPTLIPGSNNDNKLCSDQWPGSIELRSAANPSSSTFTDGTLSVTIVVPSTVSGAPAASFDFTANFKVIGVIVKDGSDGANKYDYLPLGGVKSDTLLTTPGPAQGGTYKGISHINFCYRESDIPTVSNPTVTKDAAGAYDETWKWDIDKKADPEKVFSAGGGESGTVNYTVTVTHDDGTIGNVKVTGTITAINDNDGSVTLSDVTDVLSDSTACTVNKSGGLVVPANDTLDFPYSCDLTSLPADDLFNKATISWGDQVVDGDDLAAGSADFTTPAAIDFTGTQVDECTTVNDSNPKGPQNEQLCEDDASPTEFKYSDSFTDKAGTCTKHDNTATSTTNDSGTKDEAKTTVEDCQGADLTVEKTATPSFDLTYKWTVGKKADTAKVFSAGGGESGAVNYTVSASHDAGTASGWLVKGTITITNPNDWQDITLTDLSDAIDNGGTCSLDTAGPYVVKKSDSLKVDYTCKYAAAPSPDAFKNTATAKWDATAAHTPNGSASGDATGSFANVKPTLVDECTDVSDTLKGSLGQVCVGDANPTEFKYALTFKDPAGTCTSHKNTASATTTDTKTEVKSDEVTVEDCQGADLLVSKTANPSFDLKYAWKIDKSNDGASEATADAGASVTFNYIVKVEHDAGTASNWLVKGTITIQNPNDWQDITLTDLSDAIDNGGTCTLDSAGPYVVPKASGNPLANGELKVNYTCKYAAKPSADAFKNTATAKWDAPAAHTPNGSASGDATGSFADVKPTNVTDECITVKDDAGTPGDTSDDKTLGTVCVGVDDNPKEFKYSLTFKAPNAGSCKEYVNTASFTTNDTYTKGSDTAKVKICSTNALTPGYWKNHLANSDSKGPNYSTQCKDISKIGSCSNNGPWAIQVLPQSLGGFTILAGDITTVAKIFNGMDCSSSKDQDAVGCLAGHLLAAKFNVATFGGSCILATITAADTFLSTKVSPSYKGPGFAYTFTNGGTRADAIKLKDALDKYNNGGGC